MILLFVDDLLHFGDRDGQTDKQCTRDNAVPDIQFRHSGDQCNRPDVMKRQTVSGMKIYS